MFNHDHARRPTGTRLLTWLAAAKREKLNHPQSFALIIFDCKFAADSEPLATKEGAMRMLRQLVREHLNNDAQPPVNVVFSVAAYKNREVLEPVLRGLLPNEGIAIDEHKTAREVETFLRIKRVSNGWYGYGSNAGGLREVDSYIVDGCQLRDRNPTIKRVYVWTLAKKSSIYAYLCEIGVDGVMVNVSGTLDAFRPVGLQDALDVVRENSAIRLAKRSDDAFSER